MNQFLIAFLFGVVLCFALEQNAWCESTPRGEPEFRLCSQNLHDYGDPKDEKSRGAATNALVERFLQAHCDVIAAQEVFGEDDKTATKNLAALSRALQRASKSEYEVVLGRSRDRRIHNGFIVRKDLGTMEGTKDFYRYSLPTLQTLGPIRYFSRAPLRLALTIKGKEDGRPKTFFIYTIHFKSQVDGWRDPTQTRFEVTRLEMAEAVREIVAEDIKENPGTVPIVLGDRNSDWTSGSSQIMRGELSLKDFKENCRLTETLTAACSSPAREGDWTGLITKTLKASSAHEGTFRFKKQLEVLDDILVRNEDLPLFRLNDSQVNAGVLGEFGKGSDHKLVYAVINW